MRNNALRDKFCIFAAVLEKNEKYERMSQQESRRDGSVCITKDRRCGHVPPVQDFVFCRPGLHCGDGLRIVNDRFAALQYGPVPADLYNAIKGSTFSDPELATLFNDAVETVGNEAPGILMARRAPDMDFLASAAIPYLDKSIEENKNQTFQELLAKSHDSAWKKAWERPGRTIDPVEKAEAAGCEAE